VIDSYVCDTLGQDSDLSIPHVGRYEQEMRARAESVVKQSIAGSGRFFGMRPIDQLRPAYG